MDETVLYYFFELLFLFSSFSGLSCSIVGTLFVVLLEEEVPCCQKVFLFCFNSGCVASSSYRKSFSEAQCTSNPLLQQTFKIKIIKKLILIPRHVFEH